MDREHHSASKSLVTILNGHWENLFSIVLLIAGIYGTLLLHQSTVWESISNLRFAQKQKIGVLTASNGTVRSRADDSWAWRDLMRFPEDIFGKDALFTAEGSTATLLFQDGGILKILPNTLVEFSSPTKPEAQPNDWIRDSLSLNTQYKNMNKNTIILKRGSIQYQFRNNSRDLNLQLQPDDTPINIRGSIDASVEIVSTPSSLVAPLEIKAVNSRPIYVQDKEIEPSKTVLVKSNGIEFTNTLSVSALSPKAGQRLERRKPVESIQFSWKWEKHVALKRLVIEMTGDVERSKSLNPLDQSAVMELSPGKYAWRLAGDSASVTDWIPFSIVFLGPPIPLAPLENSTFVSENQGLKTVVFQWFPAYARKGFGEKTLIEVRQVAKPTPLLASILSTRNLEKLDLLPGKIEWRLKSVSDDPAESSDWTNWRTFEIVNKLPVNEAARDDEDDEQNTETTHKTEKDSKNDKKPPLILSNRTTRLTRESRLARKLSIVIEWQSIPEAIEYRLELYSVKRELRSQQISRTPRFVYEVESPSESKVQVQMIARLKNNRLIKSDIYPLNIELSSPLLKRPPNQVYLRKAIDLLLTWERTLFSTGYEIQIAKDQSFIELSKEGQRRKNFYYFTPDSRGQYFWRVRSFYGTESSEWSETHSFFVQD